MLPAGEIVESFRHTINELDGILRYAMGKVPDGLVQFRSNRLGGEPFESPDQRMREAVIAIAALQDRLAFHFVDDKTHLFAAHFLVIEEGHEIADGLLKIN